MKRFTDIVSSVLVFGFILLFAQESLAVSHSLLDSYLVEGSTHNGRRSSPKSRLYLIEDCYQCFEGSKEKCPNALPNVPIVYMEESEDNFSTTKNIKFFVDLNNLNNGRHFFKKVNSSTQTVCKKQYLSWFTSTSPNRGPPVFQL